MAELLIKGFDSEEQAQAFLEFIWHHGEKDWHMFFAQRGVRRPHVGRECTTDAFLRTTVHVWPPQDNEGTD